MTKISRRAIRQTGGCGVPSPSMSESVAALSAELDSASQAVSEKIVNFKGKRDKWARAAAGFKIAAVALGGFASIALGWKLPADGDAIPLNNVALILTVLVTAIAAIDAYFDPRSIWILYSVAARRLELLDVRLADLKGAVARSAEGPSDQHNDNHEAAKKGLEACKRDFAQLLNDVVTGWQSVRSER